MERIKSNLPHGVSAAPAALVERPRDCRGSAQIKAAVSAGPSWAAAKVILGLATTLVLVEVFLFLPPALNFPNEQMARIMVLHVPNSIAGALLSSLASWFALRYLIARRWIDDVRSRSLASLSMLCWLLTTVTGSIFAKAEWGAYWNWDPKEAAAFILLLLYLAYFALRSGIADPDKQARAAAGYILFATVTMPFLTYILPNSTPDTLHPKNVINTRDGLDTSYKLALWSSVACFCGLMAWMYNLQVRTAKTGRAAERRLIELGAAG